jgi:uncharacterized protein with von Willebrand factor type A (vWA) domain
MTGAPRGGDALVTLVSFGRTLRSQGLDVGTGRIVTFCRAALALAPLDRHSLYWAGRATLVARREDLHVYDAAFESFFHDAGDVRSSRPVPTPPEPRRSRERDGDVEAIAGEADDVELDETSEKTAVRLVASVAEVLRAKSFEDLSEEERTRVSGLIRALAIKAPTRPSRRVRPAPTRGAFDMRRTLRASLRTEGEPFRRAWRRHRRKPRRLVLILDVSGSMSAYSRALMQFGFAATGTGHRVEVFCFGTRLTRVTDALRARDPDRALEQLAGAVSDWEGGTRIGDSLRQLLDGFGHHATIRGSVVVLCSDGLERGDPELLGAQMARLGRLAHRVVWVNPLKGSAAYQPLARGMAASLPHVDVFLPGHNLASVEKLAEILER